MAQDSSSIEALPHSVVRRRRPTGQIPAYRRLPPGQRLILYLILAAGIVLLQASYLQLARDGRSGSAQSQVKIEPPFRATRHLDKLAIAIESRLSGKPFRTGVFLIEPATGRYVNLNGEREFSAASMIKIPVLVALLDAAAKGKVKLDDRLTIKENLIAAGSGFLPRRPVGSVVTLE